MRRTLAGAVAATLAFGGHARAQPAETSIPSVCQYIVDKMGTGILPRRASAAMGDFYQNYLVGPNSFDVDGDGIADETRRTNSPASMGGRDQYDIRYSSVTARDGQPEWHPNENEIAQLPLPPAALDELDGPAERQRLGHLLVGLASVRRPVLSRGFQ